MWASIKKYFKAFAVLKECPREVWIMYGLTIFDSLAYFTLSYVLIKYLTDNYGFSDVAAGWIYGAWTMVISIVIFFVGAFTDTIGVKKALLVGLAMLVISRGLLAFVPTLPDNQFQFSTDYLVHEWKVNSYTPPVPKGQEQPKPPKFEEETWQIEKKGDELVVRQVGGETYISDVMTGHELKCSDGTFYSKEEEEAGKPEMKSAVIFESADGTKKGKINFTGKLRSRDGEKRTEWEKFGAAGVWEEHPTAKGQPLNVKDENWVLSRSREGESKKAVEEGFFQSLYSLGKAIGAGRKVIDHSKMALDKLQVVSPDGEIYKTTLACYTDAKLEGALAKKINYRGLDKEYAEIEIKNQDESKVGKLAFTGIITDVHGKEMTMWKINTAAMTWSKHPQHAGTFTPENIKKDPKPLPKMFFWSKMNMIAVIALYIGLFVLAFGTALMSPVILTAKKYYTNSRTRTTVFMGYYLAVNIAAVLSGFVVDKLRIPFGNQSIFIFGFAMVFLSYLIIHLFLREGIDEEERERQEKIKERLAKGETVDPSELEDRRYKTPEKLAMLKIVKEVFSKLYIVAKESNFWRYILFLVIILGVRLIFTHWFMVMPKYYTRVVGEGVPIGSLNAINPFLISIGLIVAVPLIQKFPIYPCFITGTIISAISMVFLMIPGGSFGFLGLDTWQGYFLIILLQIIVFSVGEVIWSPRTSEYAANIAPRGRVGAYMSLSALVLFISKPLNGLLSGWLLQEYCPEGTYERLYYQGGFSYWQGPEVMWVIYGLIAIASPIFLILLRNVIQAKNIDGK